MNASNNSQISYTGRCRQIKDAQWIIHTVQTQYPHFSTSKLKLKMQNVYRKIEDANVPYSDIVNKRIPKNSSIGKLLSINIWYQKLITKCSNIRNNYQFNYLNDRKAFCNIIKQLTDTHFGNCGEESFLSAVILKMNKIKNAYVANLTSNGEKIDHSVCIFNTDGSAFDGSFKKNTIIIDSWLGEADFAKNLICKYKGLYAKYLPSLDKNSPIGITKLRKIELSNEDVFLLNLEFDNLRFGNKSRAFMQ